MALAPPAHRDGDRGAAVASIGGVARECLARRRVESEQRDECIEAGVERRGLSAVGGHRFRGELRGERAVAGVLTGDPQRRQRGGIGVQRDGTVLAAPAPERGEVQPVGLARAGRVLLREPRLDECPLQSQPGGVRSRPHAFMMHTWARAVNGCRC